jgi:uncharacterized membrane protein
VATLLAIDLVWLGVVARKFYWMQLREYMRPDVQWLPAMLFYLLYVAGLLVLVVIPAVERGALSRAVWHGALLGLVAYATYDLTNLALARNFPAVVAVVDVLWGAVLSAGVAAAAFHYARWWMA